MARFVTVIFFAAALLMIFGGRSPANGEFTAHERVWRHRADGSISIEVMIHAVRRDGARVTVRKQIDGRPVGNRLLIDPRRQARIVIEPRAEAKVTYPLPVSEIQALQSDPQRCGTSLDAPVETRLGFTVYRQVHNLNMADEPLRLVRWVAPSLSCLSLQGTTTVIREGGEELVAEYRVERVEIGEPDKSLFEVPEHYREMTPSQLMEEVSRREGRECNECYPARMRLDEVYWSYQKR
ncbi:MAG: hypothetical protein KatS3mg005_3067 [Bryobacteraceae bacterium]|nr:MAG: hypothetical protein KatS3mg005_3067 [Bryobacteraceae bacterium]